MAILLRAGGLPGREPCSPVWSVALGHQHICWMPALLHLVRLSLIQSVLPWQTTFLYYCITWFTIIKVTSVEHQGNLFWCLVECASLFQTVSDFPHFASVVSVRPHPRNLHRGISRAAGTEWTASESCNLREKAWQNYQSGVYSAYSSKSHYQNCIP